MLKLKALLAKKIPFWLSLTAIFIFLIIAIVLFFIYRQVVYQYQLVLQDENQIASAFNLEYGSWPKMAEPGFFSRVKNQLVNDRANFIEANLSTMEIALYESGQEIKKAKIVGKGKEGSWWETPAGVYKIETKEKIHFSSIGQVYMPYSMQFQGNFFIHGIPYYPDGRETELSYTGGCIKLFTNDAKEIFEKAELGMPVLVFEKDFETDQFSHSVKQPKVSADQYLAVDLKNNFVFFQKNSQEVVSIASLTKLMTALIATEYINLEKEITITGTMLTYTTVPRLKIGQVYSAYDLLFPLMLESSNEAAQALSYFTGPQRFIELMNKKAKALGMEKTIFADSSGISPVSASNAEDLFVLAKYLYFNRNFILKISTGETLASAYGQPKFTGLANFNKPKYSGSIWDNFIGGKIGLTRASKETIVSLFELEIRGEKRPVAVIVLGSDNYFQDVEAIVNQIKAAYE
ncbi:MAG: L,D-transpeptidase family protein [Patescibacteria group bacterium]